MKGSPRGEPFILILAFHRRVATSSISLASAQSAKASSFRCGSLPNQSMRFDLERKNGGADTKPSRLSAAAAWSKPILTTARGACMRFAQRSFSAAHVAGKTIGLDSRHPSRELCKAFLTHWKEVGRSLYLRAIRESPLRILFECFLLIFPLRGHAAADVALGLVAVEQGADRRMKRGRATAQPLGEILMYGRHEPERCRPAPDRPSDEGKSSRVRRGPPRCGRRCGGAGHSSSRARP